MDIIAEDVKKWIIFYRCTYDEIHIVYQNVNISLTRSAFYQLYSQVRALGSQIIEDRINPAVISFQFENFNLALSSEQFSEIKLTFDEAISKLELLEVLEGAPSPSEREEQFSWKKTNYNDLVTNTFPFVRAH